MTARTFRTVAASVTAAALGSALALGVTPAADAAPAAPGAAAPAAPAIVKCTADDLDAHAAGPRLKAGTVDQYELPIIWTNTSDRDCYMDGFAGVDLLGPQDATFGPTYSLPRDGTAPQTLTLEPGRRAQTVITYLPASGPGSWAPSQMLVTPPDETHSKRLDWTQGPVLRQDGATRPGTYIDPVTPA